LQNIIQILRKNRYAAKQDANLFGTTLSRLAGELTSPQQVALQVVERMFSHNVELLDEAIQFLEEDHSLAEDSSSKILVEKG
jgi:hypothetical protein